MVEPAIKKNKKSIAAFLFVIENIIKTSLYLMKAKLYQVCYLTL